MAVEFSIVILMFLTMVFGIIELSRWLYGIDAANEAAREAARTAVVCGTDSGGPQKRMAHAMVTLVDGETNVNYLPTGCCASLATCTNACQGVEVKLTGYRVPSFSWVFPDMPVPNITTYLSRESMDSTDNSICAG